MSFFSSGYGSASVKNTATSCTGARSTRLRSGSLFGSEAKGFGELDEPDPHQDHSGDQAAAKRVFLCAQEVPGAEPGRRHRAQKPSAVASLGASRQLPTPDPACLRRDPLPAGAQGMIASRFRNVVDRIAERACSPAQIRIAAGEPGSVKTAQFLEHTMRHRKIGRRRISLLRDAFDHIVDLVGPGAR